MSIFSTRQNHNGHEYVVRLTSAPALEGGTSVRRSERKMRGKRMADALEMRYAVSIDRKDERRVDQRLERRAKRGR